MALPEQPNSSSFEISDSTCVLLLACEPFSTQILHVLHLNPIHARPRYDATSSVVLDNTRSFKRITQKFKIYYTKIKNLKTLFDYCNVRSTIFSLSEDKLSPNLFITKRKIKLFLMNIYKYHKTIKEYHKMSLNDTAM